MSECFLLRHTYVFICSTLAKYVCVIKNMLPKVYYKISCIIRACKEQYTEQWKNTESQVQYWTKIKYEDLYFSYMVFGLHEVWSQTAKIRQWCYEKIFWCNSSNSRKIFTLQKKIVRIMVGAHPRTPCRSVFKKLEILPVPCQYIFSLMNFFVNNQENFQTNSSVHSINTRNKHHLHRPIANLTCFQKMHSVLTLKFLAVSHIVSRTFRMKGAI
jgi:hypothetical protein